MVNSAIIGYDSVTVRIGGKRYVVQPPTIYRLSGAGYYLSEIGEGKTIRDVLSTLGKVDNLAKALSWLIAGDESLAPELAQADFDEIINGLETAYSLISAQSFIKLSTLARSVASLTAKQRQ